MSRGMTPAAILAVLAEAAVRTVAVQLDFDSAPVRLCGAPYPITIGSDEFLGLGVLGKISITEESADLQSYSMTLELSGIPRDAIALAFAEPYQGRAATVWEVPFDANWVPVIDPIVLFRGRMDQMQIQHGETSTVALTMLNRLANWERPTIRRYSDTEQQRKFPGDLGFQYASAMESKEINWPARGWFQRNPNG